MHEPARKRRACPPGVLQVVTGSGEELGPPVISLCDFLMFTGSTQVGRSVAAQAAGRLLDYSMELGGRNAMLILADADLGRTVPGAVRAAFSSTGQLCISMERMYIDTAVWDEFVPRFVKATRARRCWPEAGRGPTSVPASTSPPS